ncbi:YqhA family protein [Pseudaminobacter soli (ex Li et al. 2025)]|uniref:UPF0114 protein C7I85_23930 n=1 Tax=Pseudaminobacter soli (ex Li et al. 2025) TaxID=1295366 RepID=A0A2P7S2C2_9HYPH|nr:YqhA family protein [Mesorhizobium soli]PSJ56615.1 hypothetical protein C7I85_23930 [Mesorhizobium soli]
MRASSFFGILARFRWFLIVFYGGLALSLVGFSIIFLRKLASFLLDIPYMDDIDAVLRALGLIDATLVAGLIVMVMLSGYANFVQPSNEVSEKSWFSSLSFAGLKTKFSGTIAVISAINLLEMSLDIPNLNVTKILLLCGVQIVLLLVFLAFALAEKMSHGSDGLS